MSLLDNYSWAHRCSLGFKELLFWPSTVAQRSCSQRFWKVLLICWAQVESLTLKLAIILWTWVGVKQLLQLKTKHWPKKFVFINPKDNRSVNRVTRKCKTSKTIIQCFTMCVCSCVCHMFLLLYSMDHMLARTYRHTHTSQYLKRPKGDRWGGDGNVNCC